MQVGLLICLLGFLAFFTAWIWKKHKNKKSVSPIDWDHPPKGFQVLRHSCGGRNLIPDKWIVGNPFPCIHCKKEVLLLEARCPKCRALVKLKTYTPLFFHPIQCKACKKIFELHSRGGKLVE